MLVSDWMTRDPVTRRPNDLVGELVRLIVQRGFRRVPIVGPDAEPVGLVTKGAIYGAAPGELNPFSPAASTSTFLQRAVADVMTPAPFTVEGGMPLDIAAQEMRERRIGCLLVVQHGRLVGLLTESDMFRAMTASLRPHSPGLSISCLVQPGEDVVHFLAQHARAHGLTITSVVTYDRPAGEPAVVVSLAGRASERFVEALWRSGHRVLTVRHT